MIKMVLNVRIIIYFIHPTPDPSPEMEGKITPPPAPPLKGRGVVF
jgi:hypothetical protein